MAESVTDTIRPTDGKLEHRKYDVKIKRRARVMWCIVGKDEPVEKQLDLPAGTLRVWRSRKQPDGIEWHEFKEELDMAEGDKFFELAGPQHEVEYRRQLMGQAHRLASIAMASLEVGELYAGGEIAKGAEVKVLYNKNGRPVRVGGIRPESMTQVTTALVGTAKIIESQMERLAELQLGEDQMRRAIAQVMQVFWNEAVKVLELSKEDKKKLEAALQGAGQRAGRMELSSGLDGEDEV